ncbi:sn-glycerol-1-phosphate dehydrogenase [Methanococcus aeolicus]|uniref:Glycerol-1-phosphate dehydrogenase [NAD(P)+] n=1 Tax=Methanococcus aeolicus (strain ATCC BAA-1280 / DSM 17508 / OCM 812 / Nankai-3) TaxID=419665 RepID=G1PDH_META3|nr:sn-glycerol-1-phosphate dehydrogenase [Methanococcus aeolicus]A6UUD2.1 RecName: Full=Glycerol-1-phosphate dehydrogenase [NAD(P)+]; Short=G1P dehydrogenase; Short=G1PDH; AltName: Full=Enantiomeric glycerophosphate synthase; AltName: Full=sn-glycerol-1-phosphate dehydrogenase [Methanococcus aeolicus Nankai-3]ABR56104.1 Glutamate-1-semialdehyde 2,1-aminomutase [Methanococcus aeolicus Nankai-3]UXM85286.1 sn-glycerol-1-phosphate dehydrogenase [Methanococcus aeolicus]
MITTPRYIVIEENGINLLNDILLKLNLKNPLVITGKRTKKYISNFDYFYYFDYIDIKRNEPNKEFIENICNFDCIIGVGGGKAIDVGKYIAYKYNKQFISIPTTASNDGIASPIISQQGKSITAESPIAIIADLNIIKKSPKRLLSAGMGDIVSNITAVLDWKLSYKETKEPYSESSAIFSKTIAMELVEFVLSNDKNNLEEYPKKLVKALIGSGITISIAGSTRPASGSEHLFSHSLDIITKKLNLNINGIHGEQCGIGTIISAYLHLIEGNITIGEYENIKLSLEKVGAPTIGEQLGYDKNILIDALANAHKIRNRWTILRNGISKEKAEKILKKTDII